MSASSNHSPKRRRRRIESLAQLHARCRSAAWVWLALIELSRDRHSPVVTPTRKELSKLSGIPRHQTISEALSALEDAGWIQRYHVPVTTGGIRSATLLRIVLRNERNSFRTGARPVGNDKRSLSSQRKTCSDFFKEGAHSPPTSVSGRAPSRGNQSDQIYKTTKEHFVELDADGIPAGIAAIQSEMRAKQKGAPKYDHLR